jgi:hypothetical protein
VESPVLSDGHAGFGGRPEETDRSKDRHRASGRPNRAQGKRHNAALICLARRRCDVLFAMPRDKIPYQPRPTPPITA